RSLIGLTRQIVDNGYPRPPLGDGSAQLRMKLRERSRHLDVFQGKLDAAQAGYQLLKHRAVLWTDVCLNAVARVFLGQTHENPLKLVGLLTDRMDCFGERLHGLLLLDRRGLRLAVRLLLCSGGLITNHES